MIMIVVTSTNEILCHPSDPTDFFATQILGGHMTSRNQGLSSNDQRRQRRETLGTRLRILEDANPSGKFLMPSLETKLFHYILSLSLVFRLIDTN